MSTDLLQLARFGLCILVDLTVSIDALELATGKKSIFLFESLINLLKLGNRV